MVALKFPPNTGNLTPPSINITFNLGSGLRKYGFLSSTARMTRKLSGKLCVTKLCAPTTTLFPNLTSPIIEEPVYKVTLLPIFGYLFLAPAPILLAPIVTF